MGLVGLRLCYEALPWRDEDQKFHAMHFGGGVCLPEFIDLDKASESSDSTYYFNTKLD